MEFPKTDIFVTLAVLCGVWVCLAEGQGFSNSLASREQSVCRNRILSSRCDYFKRHGACRTHHARMRNFCKRSCGFCVPKKIVVGCKQSLYGCCYDGVTKATGPNFQGCRDECSDSYGEAFCKTIERLGGCHGTRSSNLGKRCMKTCRMCRTCEDKHFMKCQRWKRFYGCSPKLPRINNQCRKTCGFCGRKDPCFGHYCPPHHHCKVNKHRKPICACNFHCGSGDDKTGLLCGRDGKEYQNLCELKKYSCRVNKGIAVKKYGSCTEPVHYRSCSEKFKEHSRCALWKSHQMCRTRKKLLSKWCPRTCGFCKAAFDPYSLPCYNTRYGCCPDKKTPCNNAGCDKCPGKNVCKDRSGSLCQRFNHACGMDRNKSVMKILCTETCHYCVRRKRIG